MESDPRKYISGYEQLSKLGVAFYPILPDKSPAIRGRLNWEATTDSTKIRFWIEHRHHRNFAARILKRSRLLVIDTESPFKHPHKLGPDGELFLHSLLEDYAITIPPCPTVLTGSGGFHRYLTVPKGFRINSRSRLWPGIDVLTSGSSVILPGSNTQAGLYRALRTFEDCPIPEMPRQFAKMIRDVQRLNPQPKQSLLKWDEIFADLDTRDVSRRQWWLLFRNRVFRSFWKREFKAGDSTDSAYEYHLAKACFCCGLNHRQTESVILRWRQKHGLTRDLRQLRNGIIPGAWREVSPWVERWRADRIAAETARKAMKTSGTILDYLNSIGEPKMPSVVGPALRISRECAKKAMQRMAKDGVLVRTKLGYRPAPVGTKSCITTSPYPAFNSDEQGGRL